LDTITLQRGAHETREEGVSFMEAVAWFAGEPHTDQPACVSPVLAAFARAWNDELPDDERQELTRYVPLVVGTAGHTDIDGQVAWMAAYWLGRVHVPVWLRAAGLTAHAERLEALPVGGREAARSAWDVWDAVRAAWDVWDAAWDAWDAAGGTVRVVAAAEFDDLNPDWDAAGTAAKRAARAVASKAAATAAFRAAATAAFRAAAIRAAEIAAETAEDVHPAAVRAALRSTGQRMQRSAHDLFARMIDCYPKAGEQ